MSEPSDDLAALANARMYLAPKENTFWMWSDDREVLAWPGGRTIVFRDELRAVVERLAPSGLPPLGALLLLLAACRDGWSELGSEPTILSAIYGETRDDSRLRIPTGFRDVLNSLDRVAGLPTELRRGVLAKAVLAETVFEANRPLLPTVGSALVSVLAGSFGFDLLAFSKPQRPLAGVIMALSELRRGLERVDAESLKLRLRTGLDQWVVQADVELQPEESLRDFVGRLRNDPELEGLGRLARNLMATVQLPRAISDPDELPLGGVSDITNRGPLDRLLVSELAHDDLTLAVRLALNEALYLRRESPPRSPRSNRLLLIDAGIRLWGAPRIFATATALALAATADRRAQVRAYLARPRGIEPVELNTREGLFAHLERLETAPHPAAALRPFFAQVTKAGHADAVLVTHEDVLTDADFRRELAAYDEPLYLATVARDGRFRLSLASQRGLRPIREAMLDLKKLLSPSPRPTAPLVRPNAGTDLPAIHSVKPFPLLLPHPIDPSHATYHAKHGAVTVSKDGRLLHWATAGQGGRQVSAAVPRGKVWIVSVNDQGVARAVVGGEHGLPMWLLVADLTGEGCHVGEVSTNATAPRRIVEYQQTLFAIHDHHVETVVCDHESRGWFDLAPNIHWYQGRFFRENLSEQRWYALAFDGLAPRLEQVPLPNWIDPRIVTALFDRQGLDGPWAVTSKGEVVCTIDGRKINVRPALRPPLEVRAVARDGHSMAVRQFGTKPGDHAQWLVSFDDELRSRARSSMVVGDPERLVAREVVNAVRTLDLRCHSQAVGVDAEGHLLLLTRRGLRVRVEYDAPTGHLCWRRSARDSAGEQVRAFEPVESPTGTRIELAVAAWPDGEQVWLDSRGLLHLRSSDPRQMEVTLVLVCDKPIAGWNSDGKLWGPSYFAGADGASAAAPGDVLRFLVTFTAKLRFSS